MWSPPPQHWIKIDTDNSLLVEMVTASCGGIPRSHEGNFLAVWSINLGNYTITVVELWGIFWGLLVGQSLGFRNVWLEIDFANALQLINRDIPDKHVHAALVNVICNLLNEE